MDLPRPVAAVPVLIAYYGVLDEATAAVWIGLAAVLGVGLAAVNTSTKP